MALIESIRKIAKTKEIQEKLDKLSNGSTPDKAGIQGVRSTTYQTGDTTRNTGNTGNGPPVDGILGDASTIEAAAVAAIIPESRSNYSNNNTDSGLSGNYGGGFGFQPPGGWSSMQGAATEGAGSSGSDVEEAAKKGFTEEATFRANAAAAGATSEEIELAVRKKLVAEGIIKPGEYHAEDLANASETLGPKFENGPNPGYTFLAPNFPYEESIDAIIGFGAETDIYNGARQTVIVRLDGRFGTPTDADAAADPEFPQGSWADPDTPPADSSWQLGFSWKFGVSGLLDGVPYRRATAKEIADLYVEYLNGLGDGFSYSLRNIAIPSPVLGPDALATIDSTDPGSPEQTAGLYLEDCGSLPPGTNGGAAACAITTAPTVQRWPLTQTFQLSFIDGKWVTNQYDSQAPLRYTGTESSVLELYIGDGVSIDDDRKWIMRPGVNGGWAMHDDTGTGNGIYIDSFRHLRAVFPIDELPRYTPR